MRQGCCLLHNFTSQGADAFRVLAVGIAKLVNKGISATYK